MAQFWTGHDVEDSKGKS